MDSSSIGMTLNRDNALIVPSFQNEPNDQTLYEVMPYLENLAKKKVDDVRPELQAAGALGWRRYYEGLLAKYNNAISEVKDKSDEEIAAKLVELMQEMPSTFFLHPALGPKEEE